MDLQELIAKKQRELRTAPVWNAKGMKPRMKVTERAIIDTDDVDPGAEVKMNRSARRSANFHGQSIHSRLGGKKLTKASIYTHATVYCNHGGLKCKKHKEGVSKPHRIPRESYEVMKMHREAVNG